MFAAKGNQRIDDIIRKGLIEHSAIVRLTEFTGTREADIEDPFDRTWYLQLLDESAVGTIAPESLNQGRIMVQIERLLGQKFDRYHPASFLSRNPTLVDKLPAEDIARFANLFARLNKLLPVE